MPRPRPAATRDGVASRSRSTFASTPTFVSSIVAGEGGGKTRFSLTMPKPLVIVSVDPNTRAVVEKAIAEGFVDAADLTVHHLKMPAIAFLSDKDDVKEEAEASWAAFIEILRPLVDGNPDAVKSVSLDTATEFDMMNVLQAFGKSDQITPEARRNQMGPVNTRWKGVVRALSDAGVNVALLHRAREKWETKTQRGTRGAEEVRDKMTGPWDFERIGFKDTGFITSAEIQLKFDPDREGATRLSDRFGLRISRSTIRPAVIGKEWWGRQQAEDGSRIHAAAFPWLAVQLYPATTIEEWR